MYQTFTNGHGRPLPRSCSDAVVLRSRTKQGNAHFVPAHSSRAPLLRLPKRVQSSWEAGYEPQAKKMKKGCIAWCIAGPTGAAPRHDHRARATRLFSVGTVEELEGERDSLIPRCSCANLGPTSGLITRFEWSRQGSKRGKQKRKTEVNSGVCAVWL